MPILGGNDMNNGTNLPSNPTNTDTDNSKSIVDIITKDLMPSSLDGKAYSSTPQDNIWIVIHNTAGGTAASVTKYFHSGAEGRNVSTHYVIDDKEIYKLLENNWKGIHTTGQGQRWTDNPIDASSCSNSNSIGIEVADDLGRGGVDLKKAAEVCIELCRYLMKEMNIDVDHVVRHGDTQDKDCPHYFMKMGIWPYIKDEIKKRNDNNSPLQLDISHLSSNFGGGSISSGGSGLISSSDDVYNHLGPYGHHYNGNATFLDIVPNQDHRYNIANMEEVKGACLIFMPPYNVCTIEQRAEHFKNWNWDKKYHYIIDPTYDVDNDALDEPSLTNAKHIKDIPEDNTENEENNTDKTNDNINSSSGLEPTEDEGIIIDGGFFKEESRLLQCYSMVDNDKVTYINRALFKGKAAAHCIMIGCFIPSHDDLKAMNISYERVERNIINSVSKILWANGLAVKDLWREFDLNRTPSPAHYLDREYWCKLLTQIEKQVEWRNNKFGIVTAKYEKYVAVIPDQIIASNSGTGSGGVSGGTVDIGGISDVAQAVWTFFTGKGFTKECTAGILGNMYQESGVNPNAIQGNGKGPAAGICQWENYNTKSARWKGLSDYAASKGKEWTDLQCQLEWLDMELQGKDSTTLSLLKKKVGGYDQFKQMTNINEACLVFEECFERAGKPNMPRRYEAAKKYYDQFATSSTSYSIQTRNIQGPSDADGSTGGFSWPTPACNKVSSKFGPRTPPCAGASSYHKGIDIGCPTGTDVQATAAGKVVYAKMTGSAGNMLVIDHGSGWGSRYLHLDKFLCSVGDEVKANQVVAKSGATGIGTGAHLHFEIHTNFSGTKGEAQDPLKYVEPGETTGGTLPPSGENGTTGGNTGGSVSGPLITSIFGKIENPGLAQNLPYNGNSMGGLEHDEWGGKMTYSISAPTAINAPKPKIETVISNIEYDTFCSRFFRGEQYNEDGTIELVTNFQKYWELIDNYVGDHEPYDKGLVEAIDATILPNERLEALTTVFTTDNENTFHFSTIESGPGSKDHCVKAADELNYIIVPQELRCEPIYPDLVIPPQYTTTDNDIMSENTIPLSMIDTIVKEDANTFVKQLDFDYELLADKVKKTADYLGPVNSLDAYPTDDKIEELESHYPKVFIDEIEAQLYSCNHPGCPIGQPMAKNFAMLGDALMNQSKRVEQRLVRLENTLSTIMRNQARLSSRININCVYYGGQSVFNKYKCIRCLHDDRIHDGQLCTIDQCLNCTRYEPILGAVYQILDESGLNGSIILDDMQMSYSNLNDFKGINMQHIRSPKYKYANTKDESNCTKPEQTRTAIWKKANKQLYLSNHPEILKDVEDEELERAQEANYIFRMNWAETLFNQQEPDTKPYPSEGIIMRYKKQDSDLSYDEEIRSLDPELDKDVIRDLEREKLLSAGRWSETREKADTAQVNKYSSEKFYFEGFSEIKTTNGLGGSSLGGGSPGSGSNIGNAQARQKICEMAKQIVADCTAGKAWYSQPYRTTDYTKPNKMPDGRIGYDCSSFLSCCYNHAGLTSMTNKTCSGGGLVNEIIKNGGEMWLLNEEGLNKAKAGDVLMTASSKVSADQMGKFVATNHTMVYMGDGTICHASGTKNGIKQDEIKGSWRMTDGKHFFMRPKDLIDADNAASSSDIEDSDNKENNGYTNPDELPEDNKQPNAKSRSTNNQIPSYSATISYTNINNEPLTNNVIDGKDYVAKISSAVCTSYNGSGKGSSGLGLEVNKTCASHNIPYGTKIYIPELKNKLNTDGILTVTDSGGPYYDLDICTNQSMKKCNMDVYILEWGTGKIAPSYYKSIDQQIGLGQWDRYKAAWNIYKAMNGKLINFTKYNQEDTNIKNHPRYNDK